MKNTLITLALFLTQLSYVNASQAAGVEEAIVENTHKQCTYCDAWNEPQKPFQVFANTYYVGTAGLSSILIVTSEGLILIDGGLSQSASLIVENIRELGFDPADIKILLNSHAHFDHAGGMTAIQKFSQGEVFASKDSVKVLSTGLVLQADPQFGFGAEANSFAPVKNIQPIAADKLVSLGNVVMTAHETPGHTPGGTTWTWDSCENNRCLNMVYADSLSAVSADGYRFSDTDTPPSGADQITRSIEIIRGLRCDILLSPHPFLIQMSEKLQILESQPDSSPFYDPEACENYADYFTKWLVRRLKEEAE
jgi:metallo-beta-lactamase class B